MPGDMREVDMRIVVMAARELIGSKLVAEVAADGYSTVAASAETGVNAEVISEVISVNGRFARMIA